MENDKPFAVDGREQSRTDSRGQLYYWFCQMLVLVESGEAIKLTFRGGIPQSGAVLAWFEEHDAPIQEQGGKLSTTVQITPDNLNDLLDLSQRFSRIINGRYGVNWYKHTAPQTSGALKRLHKTLSMAWR